MTQAMTYRERYDHQLLRRYHDDGDVAARAELAERCLPLVRSIARRYSATAEPFDDLVQSGALGLVKAIDRFDPDAGRRFVSYAAPTIQGEIRRHFRDRCWAVRVPRSVQELWQAIRTAQQQALAEHGVRLSEDDLAEALDVPLADVREAIKAGAGYTSRSLDAPVGDGLAQLDREGELEAGYAEVEDHALVEEALEGLDERRRGIIEQRFYGERLQREVAAEIGVSQMQVSRLIRDALGEMRARFEDDQFDIP